jgi:KilA-N domain
MAKIKMVPRSVNGIVVEQRVTDGFINGTAICVAHSKDFTQWFRTKETLEIFCALFSDITEISNPVNLQNLDISKLSAIKYVEMFPGLLVSKRGSPQTGGGTWLHPDLAIQLAQWCSPAFAIQVSRWVREWMMTAQNPVNLQQDDIDRIVFRDTLKDEARLRMTSQVKVYLEQIQKYDDKKYSGMFFAKVHDLINTVITTETSKQMRYRISQMLGKEVSQQELIRDYFPPMMLQRYISVCEASANLMIQENLHPLTAVERAKEIVLPANYEAKIIDFSEHIKFVRQRISQPTLGQGNSQFLP